MTYRFYFWFQGVPKNRKGGPWWSKDFDTLEKMLDFRLAMLPFLHAYTIDDREVLYFRNDKYMFSPPQNLKITFTQER